MVALAIAPMALTEFARGDRHPDAEGYVIAGILQDPSCLIGPAILACARTPVKDQALYAEIWADFRGPVPDVTGPDVQFIPIIFPDDRKPTPRAV
ncbi:MAG: hypothetical protein GVY34_08205 [Alphaproteobacteria bacterium]|nr:hypothetical protein [Alphaproteobacteria bacterium]